MNRSEFYRLMENRMKTSEMKYGPVESKYPHEADALANLRERLRFYQQDGNTEWLVDVANFAMIEWGCPSHPDAHWEDLTDSPGLRTHDGGRIQGGGQ